MVKDLLTQLEALAKKSQIAHLKKIYPDLSGVRLGDGFLWQHPGQNRQKILKRFRQKLKELGLENGS